MEVSALYRSGHKTPIVFLHGFGSTKEDYADIALYPAFDGHPFLAYDAPGCGQTVCSDLSALSIPFLVETALAMIDDAGFDRFHLVGHSMGGLTGLMLADLHPERVLSFVDIEGNVSPEDCFLSRQVDQYPADDEERFFNDFIERMYSSPAFSSSLYATSLRQNVRAAAVPHIFRSMVDLSDNGDLMRRFLSLPCPKTFMYGEQNRHLSYLSMIEKNGVHLAEIPHCGHFPMYSNPPAMWFSVAQTIANRQML
jgi:pimeloyl-ACP methyl ester carboxylesterase